mgnify:CR=1 FL=1
MISMPRYRLIVLAVVTLLSLVLTGCSIIETRLEKIETIWAASPHGDADSGAFTHWDDDDPPEVPANCAKRSVSAPQLIEEYPLR